MIGPAKTAPSHAGHRALVWREGVSWHVGQERHDTPVATIAVIRTATRSEARARRAKPRVKRVRPQGARHRPRPSPPRPTRHEQSPLVIGKARSIRGQIGNDCAGLLWRTLPSECRSQAHNDDRQDRTSQRPPRGQTPSVKPDRSRDVDAVTARQPGKKQLSPAGQEPGCQERRHMTRRWSLCGGLQHIQPHAAPHSMLHSLQQSCKPGCCEAGPCTRQKNGKPKDSSLAPSQNRLQLLSALRGFALDVTLPCRFQSSVDRSRSAFLSYHCARGICHACAGPFRRDPRRTGSPNFRQWRHLGTR